MRKKAHLASGYPEVTLSTVPIRGERVIFDTSGRGRPRGGRGDKQHYTAQFRSHSLSHSLRAPKHIAMFRRLTCPATVDMRLGWKVGGMEGSCLAWHGKVTEPSPNRRSKRGTNAMQHELSPLSTLPGRAESAVPSKRVFSCSINR